MRVCIYMYMTYVYVHTCIYYTIYQILYYISDTILYYQYIKFRQIIATV